MYLIIFKSAPAFFPGGKENRGVNLTTHHHLVTRLSVSATTAHLPLRVCLDWTETTLPALYEYRMDNAVLSPLIMDLLTWIEIGLIVQFQTQNETNTCCPDFLQLWFRTILPSSSSVNVFIYYIEPLYSRSVKSFSSYMYFQAFSF